MIKVDRSDLLPKQQAENPIIIQRVANEWAKLHLHLVHRLTKCGVVRGLGGALVK